MKRARVLENWPDFLDECRRRVLEFADGPEVPEVVATLVDRMLEERGVTGGIAATARAATVAELVGHSVLEPLMARADVTEIMVSGTDPIWIEVDGRLERTDVRFFHEDTLRTVIERMLVPSGRRLDFASPIVDAQLTDGSRINVVQPPVAPAVQLTIRRFGTSRLTMDELVAGGSLAPATAAFLHAAVLGRANLLISGATGSGKTTLLGALASLVPESERIVTVEDVAELRIDHPNVAALQARAAGSDGVDAIALRDLVRTSMRMRPDRLIVGEVRGVEAIEMIQALNTGHAGSMSTVHANSASDAIARLETLLALGLPSVGVDATRDWVTRAIDLVVHVARDRDGVRRVKEIAMVEEDGERLVAVVADGIAVTENWRGVRRARRCLARMASHGVVFPLELLATEAA